MTDEEQDHLAVRIKHRGQCPLEKGHLDPLSYRFGIFVGLISGAFGMWIFIKGWPL